MRVHITSLFCTTIQAKAVSEATLKHSKEAVAAAKRNLKSLQKALEEDLSLRKAKESEVGEGLGAYEELQSRCKAAEKAVLAAQQHFQAVTAGLSSGADGQEETLAGQKIGTSYSIHARIYLSKFFFSVIICKCSAYDEYILLYDWEVNMGKYSVQGWQYWSNHREGQYRTIFALLLTNQATILILLTR